MQTIAYFLIKACVLEHLVGLVDMTIIKNSASDMWLEKITFEHIPRVHEFLYFFLQVTKWYVFKINLIFI